jgi:chaperonin GroES
LGDRVVVKAIEAETQTKSGLFVPDTAKERPQEGTIIAVGPGRVTEDGKRVEMDVKVGDTVVYSKFAGTEFTEDGEELLVLTERDILAKVS